MNEGKCGHGVEVPAELTAGEALRPCPLPFLKKGRTLSARHQPYPRCKALRPGLLTVSTCTAARELLELAEWAGGGGVAS